MRIAKTIFLVCLLSLPGLSSSVSFEVAEPVEYQKAIEKTFVVNRDLHHDAYHHHHNHVTQIDIEIEWFLKLVKEADICKIIKCTEEYSPVCGIDGETYNNYCELFCEFKKDFAYPGKCISPECKCSSDFKPVCAKNGTTYVNVCKMGCEGQELDYEGICKQPCVCLSDLPTEKVCGADGATYDNLCQLKCSDTSLAYKGECRCEDICDFDIDIVCGADNENYINSCFAECKGVEVASEGKCQTECVCSGAFKPVCGADGNTYINACKAGCLGIEVVSEGECVPEPKIPVCSSDCQLFESAQAAIEAGVTDFTEGGCACECDCSQDENQVCAPNGLTYVNECFAVCDGQFGSNQGPCTIDPEPPIPVPPIPGPPNPSPVPPTPSGCNCPTERCLVCGVDRKTYLNPCCAKCNKVTDFYYGRCPY